MVKVTIATRKRSLVPGAVNSLKNMLVGPLQVKVGVIEGQAPGDVLDRAIWNEFGTRGSGKGFKTARGGGFGGPIPERPFMRNGVKKTEQTLKGKLPGLARALLMGREDRRTLLNKMGLQGAEDIREALDEMTAPPNSAVTIALKKSSHPLIDTGELRSSISHEIDE